MLALISSIIYFFLYKMAHASNPNTLKAMAKEITHKFESSLGYIDWVSGQYKLHSKTLSQKCVCVRTRARFHAENWTPGPAHAIT